MEDDLDEGPLADELLEFQEAQRTIDALAKFGGDPLEFLEARRARNACEQRFWDQVFLNPGCERYRRIAGELKCLGDAEGAAIFACRHPLTIQGGWWTRSSSSGAPCPFARPCGRRPASTCL